LQQGGIRPTQPSALALALALALAAALITHLPDFKPLYIKA